MASTRTQIYTFPIPPEAAFALGHRTLNTLFGTVVQIGATSLQANTKLSVWSWGERIVLEVRPAADGSAVAVTSSSALKTQVIDFGINRRNVEKVFAAFAQTVGGTAKQS